jgi:tetratricopeptide (TPR) repeat protein
MRSTIAAVFLIASWLPCLASDDKVVHDCDYWRLGEDEAEKTKRLKACDRIIQDNSFSKAERAMAYAERADAASSAERKDEAISDLSQSLALEPDNVERRRDRAFHLYFKQQYDQAIADFDKVLAVNPTGHLTIFRGFSYLAKGDDTRGFADLTKGIELSPEDAWYRLQRGKEYAKRGKTDEALADANKAIALKSDDIDSYLFRAELFTRQGKTGEAIADLTRASEIKPDYSVPISNRVLLYEQTKQYDLALADYDKLLAMKPDDSYYKDRKVALLEKMAAEPAVEVREPSPVAPATTPKEAESKPVPPPIKEEPAPPVAKKPSPKPPRVAGKGECRRFDPIANLTISVPCPE